MFRGTTTGSTFPDAASSSATRRSAGSASLPVTSATRSGAFSILDLRFSIAYLRGAAGVGMRVSQIENPKSKIQNLIVSTSS
jgi:hypothetical protein